MTRIVIDGQARAGRIREERKRAVDAERDRRLVEPFLFDGHLYQRDPESKQRIVGAASMAMGAVLTGAQPGDYFWHGISTPFAWITADNSVVPLDAHQMFALGQAAAASESLIVHACRSLKDMNPIPENFFDDEWWP